MKYQADIWLDEQYLELNIKGCGADVSFFVREGICARELAVQLENDYNISMKNNLFNVAGKRIAGYEDQALLKNQPFDNQGLFLMIESAPLSD